MSTARAALTEHGHSSLYGRSLNARSFHRAAAAALLGYVRNEDPVAVAKQTWASDQDAHVVARAATSPSTTANTTALVQTITAEAILALAPQSAGAALLRRSLNVDLGRAGAVVVPSVVARATDFAFVGQGAAIPVVQLAFEGPILGPRKLASITVFSRELLEHSAPRVS